MRTLSRRVLAFGVVVLAGLLLLALAGSIWLWTWVPIQGKAWLETSLERRLSVDVSIRALRYTPWQGLRVEDIVVRDWTDPSIVWLAAERAAAHVDLIALAVQRRLLARINGRLHIPCEADVSAVIKAGLQDGRLDVSVATSEISLHDIQPPAARLLPRSLKDGRVQFDVRLAASAGAPLRIGGEVRATGLVWTQEALRFTGDGTVTLDVTPAPDRFTPWTGRVMLHITDGMLEGLPGIEALQQLQGTLQMTPSDIRIDSLTGRLLEAPWQLTGSIALDDALTAELHLTSTVTLQDAGVRLWPQLSGWTPEGTADLSAVCRGPLTQWPQVDLLARAQVREAAATLPALPHRLERVSATVEYDHLADTVAIAALTAHLADTAVTAQGRVHPLKPPVAILDVNTTGDLAALAPLLPAGHPVEMMQGPLAAELHLEGPAEALRWDGRAVVDGASLALRGWPKPLEALRGAVTFNADQVATNEFAFTFDGQPVTVSARLTDLGSTPKAAIQAAFPGGTVKADAVMQAEAVRIPAAQVEFGHSYLELSGLLGRTAEATSAVQVRGTVHLEDFSSLPWPAERPWTPWQLQGALDVQAQLAGDWRRWDDLTVQGFAQSDQISIRGVPLQAVTFEIEQRDRRLALHLTRAMAAEGKVAGQLFLDRSSQPSRLLLEADATQINLNRLAAMFPDWRERKIDGLASTHLSLMGAGPDRAAWNGDGWIHAEGEHLGELPLLDRLFHGVFGALGDRLGLTTLRKAQMVKLSGQWTLAQGRVQTDDLQLHGLAGTQPVIVMFHGSIGLDKTLDFVVEPNLPEQLVLEAPNTSTISRAVLRVMGGVERLRQTVGQHHLGGTIDKPEYKFQVNLDQFLNQLVPTGIERLLESLTQ